MSEYPAVSIHVKLTPDLQSRGAPQSSVEKLVERDLHRYYSLLRKELELVELTVPEMTALAWASAIRQARLEDDAPTLAAAATKNGANSGVLFAKVISWTPGQALAVVDAVERY